MKKWREKSEEYGLNKNEIVFEAEERKEWFDKQNDGEEINYLGIHYIY